MNETEILAHIGKKQIELENATTAFNEQLVQYRNLLLTLSRVLSGEVTPDRVSVNLETQSWEVTPVAQEPESNLEDEVLQ